MRSDMKKVVTERPRWGSSHKNIDNLNIRKSAITIEEDGEVSDNTISGGKFSTRAKYYGRKSFSDLLGPLKSYLKSQVGRPWDIVWSEVSQNLPASGVLNIHIRDHIEDFVTLDVEKIDGVFFNSKGNAITYPEFIVYNGILRLLPDSKKYREKISKITDNRRKNTYPLGKKYNIINSITWNGDSGTISMSRSYGQSPGVVKFSLTTTPSDYADFSFGEESFFTAVQSAFGESFNMKMKMKIINNFHNDVTSKNSEFKVEDSFYKYVWDAKFIPEVILTS